MNNRSIFFVLLVMLFIFNLNAQPLQQQQITVEEGFALWNPLSGGLNNPQFSEVDLNNDGIKDLFIFDRDGSVVLTFENGGTPNQIDYTINPALKVNFPEMKNWAMLRDYDLDGIMDLFCYSIVPGIGGMSVFKGSYDSNNILEFTLVQDYLKFPAFNGLLINLYISSQDFPAVDDIDNDGDMDVLTFGSFGGYLEFYENQSADLGYGGDSLIFLMVDECWGRGYESGIYNELELSPKLDSCPRKNGGFIGQKGVHVGSNILTWDMDNDNDRELFLGDISFSEILFAKNNAGNPDTAWFVDQESDFPSYDLSADIHLFPAMFGLDVDNDGLKDFVASPGLSNISMDVEVAWFYKNVTNNQFPAFNFVKKDLVSGGMIDIGAESIPVFFDHNGDGLLDLVLGGYGRYNRTTGGHDASVSLFENIGTTMNPAYRLINSDYGGLSALGENAFHPTFGDFDGDGDQDMVIGEYEGRLRYLENMDNGNGIASFPVITSNWLGIDVGYYNAPYAIDLNQDGLLDLVIGERNGFVNYYENQGSASSPNLVEVNDSLGLMDGRTPLLGYPSGHSSVVFNNEAGNLYAYLGTAQGVIRKFLVDQDSLYAGGFTMVDGDFGMIREGLRSKIAVADLNSDGAYDYLIGNKRGGISLYSAQSISSPPTSVEELVVSAIEFSIWPNPANDILNIGIEQYNREEMRLRIINALGQQIMSAPIDGNRMVNVANLTAGVYFVELSVDHSMVGVQKFIKE